MWLGSAYQRGAGGLVKDEKKAVELWQKAAGLPEAYKNNRYGLLDDYSKRRSTVEKAPMMGFK